MSTQLRTALPAIVVFLVLVAGGTVLASRSGGGPSAPASSTTGAVAFVDTGAALTATTVAAAPPTAAAPPSTTPGVPLTRTLTEGVSGPDVRMVQERLMALAFNPGPIDGVYGDYTVQAVWAFEKLVLGTPRKQATGTVTAEMWQLMQGPVTVQPRRRDLSRTHVEIYLPEQVLVVFTDNVPVLIAHVSSGQIQEPGDDFTKGAEWCDEVKISPGERGNEDGTEIRKDGRCGNAETPGGTYEFYRKVEGIRESALGSLYNPVYFNYGIAVHGAMNVPLDPASHGCVRLNRYLGEVFFGLIRNATGTEARPRGDDVYVWNGVEEPETYGSRPGWFDWSWEQWHVENDTTTSSTSSTSTTVTPTTAPAAPTTTDDHHPAPTTVPSATTTTSMPST